MKHKIADNIKTIFYALIIALIIRSFLFQPFYIPSSSMEPNLLVGDRLFVSKYTYGYSKHSFPFSPNFFSGRIMFKKPERGDVIDEDYPLEPVASYGRSKFLAEKICLEYMKKDVPISIIRPKTILGPNRLGIYSILFDWIKNNKPIFIFGDGQNKYSYIGITDLIDATILSATKGKGEIFNIATDKYGTYKGDIENLIQYAKSGSKTHCVNATISRQIMKFLDKLNLSPFSEWHYSIIDKEYVFDISKAQKILGWNPKKSNNQLFQESYNWFIENYEKLRITGTTHKTKLNPKIFKLINKL